MGGLRTLFPLILGFGLLLGSASQACEKHLDGHQKGSDTQEEVQQR
jgi:hypothetical protein